MMLRVWMAALALSAAGSASASAAPLEAYGALPTLENVELSPEGDRLAFVSVLNGERSVLIYSVKDHKAIGGTRAGSKKLRDLVWADPDHVVITASETSLAGGLTGPRREWMLGFSFPVNGGRTIGLLSNVKGQDRVMNVISGRPQPRLLSGRPVVFVEGYHFPDRMGVPALFAYDVVRGSSTLVEPGQAGDLDWVIDEQGKVVAQTRYDERRGRFSVRLKRNDRWTEVYALDAPIDTPRVVGIGPDGVSLILQMLEDGDPVLKRLVLADGVLTPLDAKPISNPIRDPSTNRVIGGVRYTTEREHVFFDPKDQKAWNSIVAAYPNEHVSLQSWSADRTKVIVQVSGARDGFAYQIVDLTARRADPIGDVYVGVLPQDVAKVSALTYPAADGLTIPAYLTLPNGREGKGLPLVVLPHGGPATRDTPDFDWLSQALASRGYAVLQPQFRGSDGFGVDHLAAGFGQWGRKMQTDLSDGVRELARQGVIDPKRVCIVGASYGGYAALAGATLDPDVYRCAVSIAGLSDPGRFLSWRTAERGGATRELRYWDRFMGATGPRDPTLASISPIAHVDRVKIPLLLIHGRDDTVVPIVQSQIMADAMKRAGKPVEFIVLASEDHWLSRSETRLKMLQETVRFLEANNPPR